MKNCWGQPSFFPLKLSSLLVCNRLVTSVPNTGGRRYHLTRDNRWSECIGYRIEIVCLIGRLSTILQHCTHTMKLIDLLLLADNTLHCGMYPENWRSWKRRFFWSGHFEFFKSAILKFFLLHFCEKSSPFIWGNIFFCTMDGFSRILEKKGGGLLCTPL